MIKKGTVIYTGEPFAYVVHKSYREQICDHCVKRAKLQKCSGCKYVGYCNRDCQKNGWAVHKSECKSLKLNGGDDDLSEAKDYVRLIARILEKLSKGGRDEKDYYTETKFRRFQDLISHSEKILEGRSPERAEAFQLICRLLREFKPKTEAIADVVLLEIYGKIEINSFFLQDDENDVGMGLFLGPSVMDHSCDPNVTCIMKGTTLRVIAITDLPDLDWSKIKYCYTHKHVGSGEERRRYLMENYYFSCDCKKCSSPDPLAACPNKKCAFNCDPRDTKCSGCGQKFPADFRSDFDQVNELTTQLLETMSESEEKDFSAIKSCLAKQRDILHPCNLQHLETLKLILDDSKAEIDPEEAEFNISRYIAGFVYHYGDYNSTLLPLYFDLGMIKHRLHKLEESFDILSEVRSMIEILYGENSCEINLKDLDDIIRKTFILLTVEKT